MTSFGATARAYAVHLYTASGVALAFLAAAEIASPAPDAPTVFLLFAGMVLIDASDGPLARRWQVKRHAPRVDGRKIDDIVDYLTYTFLPLLLVWRMGWLPEPAALWVLPALVASLFGFANTDAKDESGGFFLGFPSYWNVVALYAGIWAWLYGPWVNAAILLALAALTFAPLGFLYPNRAPRPWRSPVLLGALARAPGWLVALSLVYPAFYVGLSLRLWSRR
jgi:phosphatidylcholine synthase